jgi:hypothetical protein
MKEVHALRNLYAVLNQEGCDMWNKAIHKEKINIYKILIGEPQGKKLLAIWKYKREDNKRIMENSGVNMWMRLN